MEKQDLAHIEARIRELGHSLATLANENDFQEFLKIIHKQGWTTVAEVAFVKGIVDSMLSHTNALMELKQALVSGGQAVTLNPQPLPPRS